MAFIVPLRLKEKFKIFPATISQDVSSFQEYILLLLKFIKNVTAWQGMCISFRGHRHQTWPLFIMMIMRPHDVDYLVKQTIIKHAQISPFPLGEDDLKLSRSCHHRQAGCFDLIWSWGHWRGNVPLLWKYLEALKLSNFLMQVAHLLMRVLTRNSLWFLTKSWRWFCDEKRQYIQLLYLEEGRAGPDADIKYTVRRCQFSLHYSSLVFLWTNGLRKYI